MLAVLAAVGLMSCRDGVGGSALPSATPPVPTRAGVTLPTAPPSSPRLVTLQPASPTPEPTLAVVDPTPWPEWLDIPDGAFGDPGDSDRDGLTDEREARIGTDPFAWDSDYGGESDGSEVSANRDPVDKSDDVPPGSACIPEDAERPDVRPSDETPPPAPELVKLLPREVAGVELDVTSMRGLPRVYGFFNFFWDGVLLCAGGKPEDMSHALGNRGTLPAFTVMAIHVDGANHRKLGHDLVADLEAGDMTYRRIAPIDVDGREVTFLYDARLEGFTFAAYVSRDVLFLMTGMDFTDAGLWPGGVLDPEYVRETVEALPPP